MEVLEGAPSLSSMHHSQRDPAPAHEKLLCTVQPSITFCSFVPLGGIVFILFMVTDLRTLLAEEGVGWLRNFTHWKNEMT